MHGQAQFILFWSPRACHQTFFYEGAVLVPSNVILFYVIVKMFFSLKTEYFYVIFLHFCRGILI